MVERLDEARKIDQSERLELHVNKSRVFYGRRDEVYTSDTLEKCKQKKNPYALEELLFTSRKIVLA